MQTVDVSSILFPSSFADSGIGIESGVFVASLAPGSPAARECSLAVGDRLLAVSMPTEIFDCLSSLTKTACIFPHVIE